MKSYNLKSYVDLLESKNLLRETGNHEEGELLVKGLTYNSKDALEGTLFVCKGATFKKEYLEEAINGGALCYVSEEKYELKKDVPYIIVTDIRQAMPALAELFYNSPQEKLKIIGIGGTKGKTTTAFYTKAIIDEYAKELGEKPCGILSSISTYDGVSIEVSHNTTPEAMEVYRHLHNAVDCGLKYMVMEVSSQALKYNRVTGLYFFAGVFLNISEDHISPIEHKDFKDYFESKMLMFKQTNHGVINRNIDYLDEVLAYAKQARDVTTFTTDEDDGSADYKAYDIKKKMMGSSFNVKGKGIEDEFVLSMPGLFNVDNALAAICVAEILEIPKSFMKAGLLSAKVKGRMETFHSKDENIIGIVDYAHNKLSFEKLFSSLKKEFPQYHITAVFGCPGGKAFGRRKEMGTIAGKYADDVILTADEPGFESVADISNEISKYINEQGCPYVMIEDRGEALRSAVLGAKGKTLVVAAGKGHEGSQKIKDQYVDTPSDIEYMEMYLKEYDNKRG